MFRPTRKDWPAPHRTLLTAFLAALALLLMAYGVLLHPRRLALAEGKARVERKEARFQALELPRDAELLRERLQEAEEALMGAPGTGFAGLRELSRKTAAYYTALLDSHVKASYSDNMAFIYGATRLDYKELHERIAAQFAGEADDLDSSLLDAEREIPADQPVWQTIARLWTLQEMLERAHAGGLVLAERANGVRTATPAPVAYTLQDTPDGQIFLMEFPVEATFSGTMEAFLAFLGSLQDERGALPMKRLAICSAPPEALLANAENAVDHYLFTVQCCAFLDPHGGTPVEESADANAEPPPGAVIPEEAP